MLENDYLNTVNYNFYFWCKYCYLKPVLFRNYTYLLYWQFTKLMKYHTYFKLLFGSNFVHVVVEWPLIDSDLFISTPRFSLILCFGGKEKYTN